MVSVIIPVYNAEKSLVRCLDSIFKQTYTDYEVIIVNDGSMDNSQKVIDEYRRKYPEKIKVYTQTNSGAAVARNKGMEYASGEYIFFIDNDDYIKEDYIEKYVNEIVKKDADMVIGGYRRVKADGEVMFSRDAKDLPWTKYMMVAPWGRVYRAESLKKNNIKFLDSNIWEDVYFNMLANFKLKVSTIDYNGYYWVYNPSSFSNTTQKNLNPFVDLTKVFTIIKDEVDGIGIPDEEKEYFEYFFIKACVWYLIHSGKGVEYSSLKREYERLFNWLQNKFPNYMKNKQIGILKPKGESFSVRLIVSVFVLFQRMRLQDVLLRILNIM
jgi:glycosyltransferase involved in cell wall biosynthesis